MSDEFQRVKLFLDVLARDLARHRREAETQTLHEAAAIIEGATLSATPRADAQASDVERALLLSRLRQKEHRGRYQMGGGSVGGPDGPKSWGGEKIMEWRNPDGPAAADLIERLAAMPAQPDKLVEALRSVLNEQDRGDGNAPGHAHSRIGIWDDDSGNAAVGRANKPCDWCATWAKAREALSAWEKQPIGENPK